MANRYWVAAAQQNWNDTTYWSDTSGGAGGFSVPGSSDDVTFNGSGVGNCVINAAVNVNSLNIASGYTGTFNNATNDQSITVAGNCTLNAGTVTAGDATWTIGGNFSNASTAFTANLSTVVLTGSGVTLTSSNSDDFYNLTIASGATVTNSGNIDINGSGAILQIDGTLTMNTSTLRLNTGGCSLRVSSTGILQGTGTLQLLIDTRCTQQDGQITIANMIMESRHATANSLVPGTYESPSVLFRNGDALTRVFELQSGTYIFTGDVQIANTNSGTYNFNCNVNNPNIEFRGNVTLSASAGTLNYNKGTGTITLAPASGTKTINFFDKFVEDIEIDGAGTVQLTDGVITDSFTGTTGTIDFNGQSIETNNNFTLTSGCNIISDADAMNACSILVGGDFLAEGSNGDLLDLGATASWTLWVVGSASADYVNVEYSDASSGTTIDATNSTNGGNNLNWNFITASSGNMFLVF